MLGVVRYVPRINLIMKSWRKLFRRSPVASPAVLPLKPVTMNPKNKPHLSAPHLGAKTRTPDPLRAQSGFGKP